MNEKLEYHDIKGDPISLLELIKKEPEWAEGRIKRVESELAEAKAENEKLREIFKIYWINQEKVHTERSAESFLKLGEHFDFWLKQELEGIC